MASETSFTLKCKTITGDVYLVTAVGSMTVKEVKADIASQHGCPPDAIRLIKGSKMLKKNENTVANYGITGDCLIRVVIRLAIVTPSKMKTDQRVVKTYIAGTKFCYGDNCLAITGSGKLVILDVATVEVRHEINDMNSLNKVCFARNSKVLLVTSGNSVCYVDYINGKVLERVTTGYNLCDICISGNDEFFAFASHSGDIGIVEFESHEIRKLPKNHTQEIRGLCISKNNESLVVGCIDHKLTVYDLTDDSIRHTLAGHSDWVTDCQISWDDSFIVSTSFDDNIILWDIETGAEIRRIEMDPHFQNRIHSLDLTKDDQYAVTCSGDKAVRLWHIPTGQLIHSYSGHTSWVYNVCLMNASGGAFAASTGDDGNVYFFNIYEEINRANVD